MGIAWQPPVVGPNADGGINREWEGESRQLFVMIRPRQQPFVECVTEEPGALPRRQTLSVWDTMDLALGAISRGLTRSAPLQTETECLV